MLINIRTSELQTLFVTILFNYTLFQLLPYYIAIINSYNSKISKYSDIISNTTSQSKTLDTANVMFVTTMVGAIIITIKQERNRGISSIGGTFVLHTKC
uniref:Uncharacterized protein n=1 Tax=Romanomermis culicivorax TaxID=13658 RepID=A0A915KBA0_ROMCU